MNSLGRFHIARDLKDWLFESIATPVYPDKKMLDLLFNAQKSQSVLSSMPVGESREYTYLGNPNFQKFLITSSVTLPIIYKYYPDTDIFLKNIYWSAIVETLKTYCNDLSKILSTAQKPGENTLVLIHLSPLQMVVLGEALIQLGYTNTVYNFNRSAAINSSTKSMEALLFLVSYRKLPWLKKIVEDFAQSIAGIFGKTPDQYYLYFQENDLPPKWEVSLVDPYIQNAISWKNPRITYRLEEYPTRQWLMDNSFKNLILIDSDDSRSFDAYYTEEVTKGISVEHKTISIQQPKNPGMYEEYVCLCNQLYLANKSYYVAQVAENALAQGKGTVESKDRLRRDSVPAVVGKQPNINKRESGLVEFTALEKFVVIIVVLAMVSILFKALGRVPSTGGISSSGGGWSSGGGTSWGGGSSSSSSNSSISNSSSSSIKSFGGGGFSKGSGG